jgi:TolB protein
MAYRIGFLASALLLGVACGDGGPSGPQAPSALRVIVTTVGSPADPDGYYLQIDQEIASLLPLQDTLFRDGLTPGQHLLFLTGIAPTCWPDPNNEALVNLPSGDTLTWSRIIRCEALPAPLHGKISFERVVAPDNADVFLMNTDGTAQSNLTHDPAWDALARISPDGRFVVFFSTRGLSAGIYRVRSDGRGATRLTPPALQATWSAWSPDEQYLAFSSVGGAEDDIYSVSADGAILTNLTPFHWDAIGPAWSPDGRRIAFWGDRDSPAAGIQIYVLDLQTHGITRLTATDAAGHYGPDWSPDGQWISLDKNVYPAGGTSIWVMRADGSQMTQLTSAPAGLQDFGPSWSPDGTRLAFTSDRGGHRQIYAMNADGTQQVNLSNGQWEDSGPDWSP